MDFQTQITHPKWQKKRLEILQRDEYVCQNCHSNNETLHVHHFTYKTNTKLWEYDNNNLITFCEQCHNDWHETNNFIKKILSVDVVTLSEIYNLLQYVDKMNLLEISNLSKLAKEIVDIK